MVRSDKHRLEGVRVLSHVRALPPDASAEAKASIKGNNQPEDEPEDTEGVLDGADARAFRDAGWTFVGPDAPTSQERALEMVVDRDGHLKALAPGLTVRFEEGASKERIAEILETEALAVRRRPSLQSNLYTVEGKDALAKARRLNSHPEVVYADPVMIEPISGRKRR